MVANDTTIIFLNQELQKMHQKVQETERDCKRKLQQNDQNHKVETQKLHEYYQAIIYEKDQIIAELESKLNTNSTNSSLPPSTDLPKEKPTNKYNSRKQSGRKKGGQKGRKGVNLSKKKVQELIDSGEVTEKVIDIGDPNAPIIKDHFVVDIKIEKEITRIRVHEGAEDIKLPKAPCSYGKNIKSIAVLLYAEGNMSNERICSVLREFSEGVYPISSGFVYETIKKFASKSDDKLIEICKELANSPTLYTDDTTMPVNGKKHLVRNISNGFCVLYWPHGKKNIEALFKTPVLVSYSGNLVHDHETAMYNLKMCKQFECLAHLLRRLRKSGEDTGNTWQFKMIDLLTKTNKKLENQDSVLNQEELNDFLDRYDEIIELGYEENKTTKVKKFQKKEKSLLNDLKKYKDNYTGFAFTIGVEATNNLSERDLRKIVCRRKAVYGTREFSGLETMCKVLSVTETLKKQNKSLLKGLNEFFD